MYNYSIQNTVWCFTLVKWTLFSFGEISAITDSYNITDSILRLIFQTKKDISMNKMLYLLKLWGGGGRKLRVQNLPFPTPQFPYPMLHNVPPVLPLPTALGNPLPSPSFPASRTHPTPFLLCSCLPPPTTSLVTNCQNLRDFGATTLCTNLL